MALLDILKPKVRTLDKWSPDVPRERIDIDALVADMRPTGVAALDSLLAEALDGERVPFMLDYNRPRQIADTLSETDRLLLLARAAQTAAAVRYIELTWPDVIPANKARAWAGVCSNPWRLSPTYTPSSTAWARRHL